jgi:Tol biopolymer transport system component
MVVNVGDPSSAHVLVPNPATSAYEAPVWSPDGSQIAFQDWNAAGLCQIAVMTAMGQNPQDITNSPVPSDQKPDWQALTQNSQGQNNDSQGQDNNHQ